MSSGQEIVQQILNEIAPGAAAMVPHPDGGSCIAINQNGVIITVNASQFDVSARATIGYFPKSNLVAPYRWMLELNNHLLDCHLAVVGNSAVVVALRKATGLNKDGFVNMIEGVATVSRIQGSRLKQEFGVTENPP
jgi:hypothetical protein